jgi:hypothetical protein
MNYKLIYLDGTVAKTSKRPDDFTGTIIYDDDSKSYWANGHFHRDGGLPAYDGVNGYNSYWVNEKWTGQFWY